MRKPRVYIGTRLASGQVVELDRTRGHYLKNVLRLKPGAAFFLFDGRKPIDYEARLLIDGKKIAAEIGAAHEVDTESILESEIIQGLSRGDHTDWTIQKTTELGVKRITIFNAEHSQLPLKPAQLKKKLAHWRGVAISACEQCGRAVVPEINFHAEFEAALIASDAALKLMLDFSGDPIAAVLQNRQPSVCILLGPEGGLNSGETRLARESGFRPASLGERVLRTETAATAALAIIQSSLG